MDGDVADQRGEEGSDAAAEVVGEALGGAADGGGKEFGEEGSHGTEGAGGEGAEGEAEQQGCRVADGDDGVEEDGEGGERGEEDEGELAAELVGEMGADEVAGEGAEDHDEEVASGVGDVEAARVEVEREPGVDGVVAALRAERDDGGERGDAEDGGGEDF